MAKSQSKLSIEFDGFEDVLKQLRQLEGDIKGTCERALIESFNYVTAGLAAASEPHNRTGKMMSSLRRTADVQWTGDKASCAVGFDISGGGLPSIFLMYGTPRRQPTQIKADKKMYKALFGKATKNAVSEIQRKEFYREIDRIMGG